MMKSVFVDPYFKDVQQHNLQRPYHYLEYKKDIPKFEKANNVLISVYGYQEGKDLYIH